MIAEQDEIFESLAEAARYAHVGRQAIFQAIKKGRLRARKEKRGSLFYWIILKRDLDAYRADKHNRDETERDRDGNKVIDLDREKWSVTHAAKTLTKALGAIYNEQHIYYLLQTGQLKGSKYGARWIIAKADLVRFYQKELAKFESYKQLV